MARRLCGGMLLAALLWLVCPALAAPIYAATFTVNSNADAPDNFPGDGICETATGNGICTLRAAVMEANVFAGADTIHLPPGTINLTINPVLGDDDTRGDVDIRSELTIIGAGRTQTFVENVPFLVDKAGAFEIHPGSHQVRIENLTVRNAVFSEVSGIVNQARLTLDDVEVRGNRDGGIINVGTLTGSRVYLRDNQGSDSRDPAFGLSNSGTATLTDTIVSENGRDRAGGGVLNSGSLTLTRVAIAKGGTGFTNSGTAVLTNVTVSNNSRRSGVAGIDNTGDLTVTNGTIAGNFGFFTASGTGLGTTGAGVSRLRNTILAYNRGGGTSNCVGSSQSLGNNLDSGDTCGFTAPGDRQNVDPRLGDLADNGDGTFTHAQLEGSPAIDTGTDTGGCPATDQRGAPRPVDGTGDGNISCDIGAYELQTPFPVDVRIAGLLQPNPVQAGGVARAVLEITNERPAPAPGLVVTAQLPHGTVYRRFQAPGFACNVEGTSQVRCTSTSPLGERGRATIEIEFSVEASAAGTALTASVAVQGTDATPANNQTSLPLTVTVVQCNPRPPVQIKSERIGAGLLQVTVTVQDSPATPNNALQSLRTGTIENAIVQVNGQSFGNNALLPVPAGARQFVFRVDRDDDTRRTHVPFTATDNCGAWPHFVGGGPTSF